MSFLLHCFGQFFSRYSRGIYFAASSAYANKRSYRPIFVTDERPKGQLDECELLLAKLLKGTQIEMEACSDLIVPPIDPTSGLKYNTVAGRAKGSNVWIVYENGRAYPDYLVRFYKGARDLNRTPYNSLDDAQGILASRGVYVAWEFQEDLEWKEYSAINQQLLETAYVSFCAESGPSVYPISTNAWRYQVAFPDMMQTNIEHHVRNQRSVRRSIGRQNATVTSVLIIWEFQDDDACWKGYDVSLQHATEDAYAKFLLKPTSGCYQTIVTANVTCTVEFESMLQMEPHDSDYKFCSIRRRIAI